ncbi:trans-sulfuration enzyme family protein [Ruminococcus sp.]|uniref:trans-sulfuration enzyme family protein n=1 Tax=Ruminococcus sp. TaxID=41978 RepID=UPI002E82359C|nr:aminotransferase class I/II-fold pyridoxal phosphate-dependent enzyme [Ruminococcus sp.]MEE3493277.1 aminotransferase class I/II-fold pyridoxal phosphate-dependent enzyme [Ruminococcus sp.]
MLGAFKKESFGFHTRAVHTGNDVDKETGAVKRPITMANSYELPYDPTNMNWSSAEGNLYTRNGGANQKYLQERLVSLEGGEDCIVLASGVAALSGLFFSLLKAGDHVVFSSVTYIAVYRLLNELFNEKFGVETTIVDTTDLDAVKAAIRPNTKLIHIETPGNPTISVTDISALAAIAHKNDALLSVDNTFASPYNQRPIELGADFTIESLTKYINGHGDAMGGAIIGKKAHLDIIRAQAQVNLGGTISPFNAWLIMRGSVTLPLRMKQHNENALKIAKWLEERPGVSFVSYPGLESHPQHEIALRQMAPGFGGVLTFGLKADHETHNRFVSHLRVITNAVSLGHDASLIVFLGENDERQHLYPERFHNGFFRFSVGIEDADDLIEDLRQALDKVGL